MKNEFKEWENYIEELKDGEKRLLELKKEYLNKSQEIINNTDFKELYGRNNESVRKEHINKELKELVDEIDKLKLMISDRLRRIEYLKVFIQLVGADDGKS